MTSATAGWITAGTTMLVTDTACIAINGTWKFFNSWAKARTPDPTKEVARQRDVVEKQAETIEGLLGKEILIIDMLGNVAELLDSRSY